MPHDSSLPTSVPPSLPHVVIVGAGFGGLYAARALGHARARITVVDRHNYHLFQPLLYQVATAALNPSDIAYPIRRILRRQKNAAVLLGDAVAIDAARKQVILSDGAVPFDKLVIATGATHSYFGHDDWAARAPGLKSIEDALDIRRRVLLAFEAAERATDERARAAWLTFVIVGGGPTGVELAGAFAEIARHTLAGDFRNIDPTRARILLLEGDARVLPPYSAALSEKARRQLTSLGVEVRTGSRVIDITATGVTLVPAQPQSTSQGTSQGTEHIESHTVIWAAGVAASPLARSLDVPLDRAGRVKVNPDLTIPGHPDIFVIGDLASLVSDGKPVPGVAPAAIQAGRHAAKNILLSLDGKPHVPFHYWDKGNLATIGRSRGVAQIRKFEMSGLLAWMAWLFVHIFYLIGFRNRFVVMFEWGWSYLTYQRAARLITGPTERGRS